ncbi:unnamed protein product, partial [Ectocarpus sp. 13 AM-2016]
MNRVCGACSSEKNEDRPGRLPQSSCRHQKPHHCKRHHTRRIPGPKAKVDTVWPSDTLTCVLLCLCRLFLCCYWRGRNKRREWDLRVLAISKCPCFISIDGRILYTDAAAHVSNMGLIIGSRPLLQVG